MAVAASLAWNVENNRCPVKAALTAISAVSKSRISPTKIMSGSCLTIDRRPLAKVKLVWVFTWIELTPKILYSTGSSMVVMFTVGLLSILRRAYKVVVLPEPVGPVTRIIPNGFLAADIKISWSLPETPKSEKVKPLTYSAKSLTVIFSPSRTGITETRISTFSPAGKAGFLPLTNLIAPSWAEKCSSIRKCAWTLIRFKIFS